MENEDDNGDNDINYKDNNSSRISSSSLSSFQCASSTGLSSSSSNSSTLSSLKSLNSFDKTRCLYVFGYRFKEFIEKLKESTKISFQVLDESENYGIIHFECGMKTNKINVINQTNTQGLKFYTLKRIKKQNCLVELASLGLALAEEKRNMSSNQTKFLQKGNSDEGAISSDQSFENDLFFELSNLLLINLNWGMSDLYSHVMQSSDCWKKLIAAIVLSKEKHKFMQIIDSKQQYAQPVNFQLQPQLFSFIKNGQEPDQAATTDNNQAEHIQKSMVIQKEVTTDSEQFL